VAGYEQLRQEALVSPHHSTGMAVLIRRGVLAWMHTYAAGSTAPSAKPHIQSEAKPAIPNGLYAEIILILAGMLLHGYLEART
jgi:hypothetical protein